MGCNVEFDYTIGMDGGILDEDYIKILDMVSKKFESIDYKIR